MLDYVDLGGGLGQFRHGIQRHPTTQDTQVGVPLPSTLWFAQ
jgi:hypothetical protein